MVARNDPGGPGASHLGVVGIVVTAVLLVVLGSGLVAGLIVMWPTGTGDLVQNMFGLRLVLDRERAIFIVIAMSGSLGGVIHGMRSLYWYVGNREFRRSWLLFYVCVPFIGAGLGLVFYIVVRGGLISGQAAAADINPYGFCAVSALVGLFSSQAIEKLKQVFGSIFAPAETGRDHVPPT